MILELVLDREAACDDCGESAKVTLASDDAPAVVGFWSFCHGCLILKLLWLASLAITRVH